MPKLQDTRKIIEIELETIKGGVVKVYDSLLAADVQVLADSSGKAQLLEVLGRLIKEWNLEDDSGQPLPITAQNIGKLDLREVNRILKEVNLTKDFLK